MPSGALPIGFILRSNDRQYVVEDVLGKGGFGITYKVKSRVSVGNIAIDAFFAVKEFFPDFCWRGSDNATVQAPPTKTGEISDGLEDFIVEGQRLQQICKLNPNIVNVNEVFKANGTAYYVMEYLSGGDLRKLVKENGGGFSEATMMSILTPVASALESVHSNMMLHLDIKPDNIVMRLGDDGTPDVPVLIDFGIAVHFKKDGSPTTKHPTKGLTPGFSPAEQYEGIKRFDPRLDIYALSATCYYMLTGLEPKSAFEMSSVDVYNELSGHASERTVNAIVKGLSKEAADRPATISQFMKLFKETHALPVGAIVRGQSQNYMILGVVEETETFIHYKTTIASGYKDSSTTTQGTKRTIYNLWEYFVPGVHKRQPSGEAIATTEEAGPQWSLPTKFAGYAVSNYGSNRSSQGILDTEYFYNGTEYLAVRQGYKPTPEWVKSSKSMWKKIWKPLLYILGALAIMAAAWWLVATLIENNKQKHLEASAKLQEAIDCNNRDTLLEFAEQDSVRAYLPLAAIYEQENNYKGALEMAKKALDSGELSPSDKQLAQEFINKLTPLIKAKEPVQEELPTETELLRDTVAEAKAAEPAEKKVEKQETNPKKEVIPDQPEPQKPKVDPKPKKSDDEIVQDAFNRGDMETVRAYARKGNKKAKILSTE